jgi:tetratricopeptide (TPR) repeat protein
MAKASRWGAALLSIALAGACASRSGVDPESELPVGPTELGVLFGVDVVARWTLVEDEALGDVGSVSLGADRFRVVGTAGSRIAPAAAGETGWTAFEAPGDWTTPADIEPLAGPAAGPIGYVSRGGNGSPVGTYDAAGKILWRSDGPASRLAAADLDGDGALDLVLGGHGRRGLQRLDAQGARIWSRRESRVRSVELADVDGDGTLEILHSHAGGELVVRSGDGSLRERRLLAEPVGHFALELRGEGAAAGAVVYAGENAIHRVGLAGGAQVSFPTIHPVRAAEIRAATVRLGPSDARVHAFLADFRSAERSFLALYDGSGALLHETVLDAPCGALAVDRTDPEGDVLAVGCRSRVELFGRGVPLLRRALAAREAIAGADDPSLAEEHRALAQAYTAERRYAEAEPHAWRSVELLEKELGANAPGTAASQSVLGSVQAARGEREAAELRLLSALALATPEDAPDHAEIWSCHAALGAFYADAGQTERAEAHDRRALALLPDRDRATSRIRADIAYRLAALLHAAGRQGEAAEAIDIAIEHDTSAFGPDHAEVQTDRALAEKIRAAASASPASPAPAEDAGR